MTIGIPAVPDGPEDLERMFRGRRSVLTLKDCGVNGDWRIDGRKVKLHLYKISHLLTGDRLRTVDHEEIAWGKNLRKHRRGPRYDACDISFPGILCEGAPNPQGKKYLIVDGAHRMGKMDNMKITQSSFYVIEYAIIKPFFIYPS